MKKSSMIFSFSFQDCVVALNKADASSRLTFVEIVKPFAAAWLG
jgi:hypothetical protein